MRLKYLFVLPTLLFLGSPFLQAAETNPASPVAASEIDFARDVAPLLAKHCHRCHGAKKQESGYRLDVRSAAPGKADFGDPPIVPGKGEASPLYQVVAGTHEDEVVMPPEDEGERLAAKEIATLRAWIDQGAKWPDSLAGEAKRTTDHWSFQPVKDVIPPKLDDRWIANPIDAFILAKLAAADLKPAKPA